MVSKLKDKDFYDKAANNYYKNINAPKDFFQDVKKIVPESHSIIDIGCGSGYFYYYCNGERYKDYLGVDFSPGMIERAKEYNPTGKFIVKNIYTLGIKDYAKYDMVVCLEVLEHVLYDVNVLENISSGKSIVLSVPNFDDTAHIRKFGSEDDIYQRYSKVVKIYDIIRSYTPRGNIRFICKAVAK